LDVITRIYDLLGDEAIGLEDSKSHHRRDHHTRLTRPARVTHMLVNCTVLGPCRRAGKPYSYVVTQQEQTAAHRRAKGPRPPCIKIPQAPQNGHYPSQGRLKARSGN
jgi:hypothetical protein